MLVKTFENNGKNISKNIVKLNLEQNIKSLLCNQFDDKLRVMLESV